MAKKTKFPVSSAPFLKEPVFVHTAMLDVIIALIPISILSIYFYKLYAISLIVICMLTALITELVFRKIMGKKSSLNNYSALLTGLFVALLYQPTVSPVIAILATIFAVGVAKELVGGLGMNRFNPALFGRVVMILLAPVFVKIAFKIPDLSQVDVISRASPLAMLASGFKMPSYLEMFMAYPGGALSETSPLALLIGGIYLYRKGHINWYLPVSVLGAAAIMAIVFGQDPIYHLLTGGLMIGSIFMATDWVTSPITASGKVIFGASIGVLVMIIRVFLPATEGVAYSILIMNALVPVIDNATKHLGFLEPKKT